MVMADFRENPTPFDKLSQAVRVCEKLAARLAGSS
jgi:hypothetical protein